MSTLASIQKKVRRLTRNPSPNELSDTDLNDYINTFILYDFPEQLRLFTLHEDFTFYCEPNRDQYPTDKSWPISNPLYDFKNKYITMNRPVYMAGFNSYFSQSQEEFFGIYPINNSIQESGQFGDGVTQGFGGTISTVPLLQNNVSIVSIDINGNGLAVKDVPIDNETGNLQEPDTGINIGTINYITGAWSVTFPTPPGNGVPITYEVINYQPARPQAMLYFANIFTLRPVPDKPYPIQFQVYKRPTSLLEANQSPELEQWWQYIAYGAAKKVFEDRAEIECIQEIMPEFKMQERLVLRRTIVQNTNKRAATIYTNQVGVQGYYPWGGFGPF